MPASRSAGVAAYSLVSRDYGKLGFVIKLLTPGLVFVDDAGKFADAAARHVAPNVEIAASPRRGTGPCGARLADLMATPEDPPPSTPSTGQSARTRSQNSC